MLGFSRWQIFKTSAAGVLTGRQVDLRQMKKKRERLAAMISCRSLSPRQLLAKISAKLHCGFDELRMGASAALRPLTHPTMSS
jgi:hypothetical protein